MYKCPAFSFSNKNIAFRFHDVFSNEIRHSYLLFTLACTHAKEILATHLNDVSGTSLGKCPDKLRHLTYPLNLELFSRNDFENKIGLRKYEK